MDVRFEAVGSIADPALLARIARDVDAITAADDWDAGDGVWTEKEFQSDAREAARTRLEAHAGRGSSG